jgi:hypothetical protein
VNAAFQHTIPQLDGDVPVSGSDVVLQPLMPAMPPLSSEN